MCRVVCIILSHDNSGKVDYIPVDLSPIIPSRYLNGLLFRKGEMQLNRFLRGSKRGVATLETEKPDDIGLKW